MGASRDHILAVLSSLQDAKKIPPGDQQTPLTSSVCPVNVLIAEELADATLHTCIDLSCACTFTIR